MFGAGFARLLLSFIFLLVDDLKFYLSRCIGKQFGDSKLLLKTWDKKWNFNNYGQKNT